MRWNQENQLVQARTTRHGVTQITTYDYDALGRRIAKHDTFGTLYFTWEGMRLIQEQRATTIATHIYAPGSYEPLARIDFQVDIMEAARNPGNPPPINTSIYYFHTNVNGAPEEMTDQRGTLAWQARYAVWGNTIMEQWSQQHRPDATGMSPSNPLPQNLRMQGQYYDVETGLCYNTFRYYDADVGRFVSPDPIGLAGGMNLYAYAPNPFSWIDPWGWACTLPNKGSGRWKLLQSLRRKLNNLGFGGNAKGNQSVRGMGKSLARVNHAEADYLGKKFVGDGHSTNSQGMLISKDGTRLYRPPTAKPNSPFSDTGTQANFVERKWNPNLGKTDPLTGQTPGAWEHIKNGHIDIAD